MAMSLREYYSMSSAESYGHLGMEIETEYLADVSNTIFRNIPTGWNVKADNSLRNYGLEYTTVGACRTDNKNAVLKALLEMLDKHTKVMPDSPRTSFHVHLNQADLTPLQIAVNISAYWLIEELLLEMCSKYRRGNLHCLSLKEAPAILTDLVADYTRSGYFSTLSQERLKYSGGNTATLRRFGTFEVRLMDGRLDLDRMILWTDILCDITMTPYKNFKSPRELLDFVYDSLVLGKDDGTGVLTKLFSSPANIKHVAGLSKDLKAELLAASRRLMPLAYSISDWSRIYTDKTGGQKKQATRTERARVNPGVVNAVQQPPPVVGLVNEPDTPQEINARVEAIQTAARWNLR